MSPQLAVVVDERGQISSAVQFLSSCKHWDSGIVLRWENNMQHCGHTVDSVEMCELKQPRGRDYEDCVLCL